MKNRVSKVVEEVLETNTYQCHIQNHIWGFHVQYTGTVDPLQYLITSYDTNTRPRILQRWIEATIYNDESSKSGGCVTEHNIILRNLGYKGETKVFIEIQGNQYNPYHVNRCVDVEHGKNSTNCQSICETDKLKQRISPIMIVKLKVPSSKL